MAEFFLPNKSVGDQNSAEDWRIRGMTPLTAPDVLQHEIRQTEKSRETVINSRKEAVEVVHGVDEKRRLMVVIGPCSIHDPAMALEYCDRP